MVCICAREFISIYWLICILSYYFLCTKRWFMCIVVTIDMHIYYYVYICRDAYSSGDLWTCIYFTYEWVSLFELIKSQMLLSDIALQPRTKCNAFTTFQYQYIIYHKCMCIYTYVCINYCILPVADACFSLFQIYANIVWLWEIEISIFS